MARIPVTLRYVGETAVLHLFRRIRSARRIRRAVHIRCVGHFVLIEGPVSAGIVLVRFHADVLILIIIVVIIAVVVVVIHAAARE